MNQEELLKSLMELDFIAVDLGLFLNTHPDDSDAIAAYNQVITAADTVRMKYEETFGPLCSFRSYAANTLFLHKSLVNGYDGEQLLQLPFQILL